MYQGILEQYANVAGEDVIDHLRQVAESLKGMKVVHINSTRDGGGVAEILNRLVPLMQELNIDASWQVILGNADFFQCTKGFHNALQGRDVGITDSQIRVYEETNATNAEILKAQLEEADVVFVHDPQPVAMIKHFPKRKGKWIWRCHIDLSKPYRPIWKYIRDFVTGYDASIFSLSEFAQALPHPVYLIPPSIDPLSEKNIELDYEEINSVYERFNLDPERPVLLQVSRFDRFKDPLGVIHAYKLAKAFMPFQLVMAGGSATDDPEGDSVLEEVRKASSDDPDIHILLLPSDAHRTINALQRASDLILQKSIKEGFGLTVTEAMWKAKPVIGGDVGGIKLQIFDHNTGFLVHTPEGAALRIRYLFHHRDKMQEMGMKAKQFVKENFLLTRHLREYLTLIVALINNVDERIELS
ncbi:glycosyltransferase [bacterium]|nr:glycosyltransferase [bacterium]